MIQEETKLKNRLKVAKKQVFVSGSKKSVSPNNHSFCPGKITAFAPFELAKFLNKDTTISLFFLHISLFFSSSFSRTPCIDNTLQGVGPWPND